MRKLTTSVAIEPFDPDRSPDADLRALHELWTAAQTVDVPDTAVTYSYDVWLAAFRQSSAGRGERRT